jgi:cyclopropane-fatty-acyl-phospholipid synthase
MEKQILAKLLAQIKHGTLIVTFADSETRKFGKGEPKVSVKIKTNGLLKKAVKSPSLALGEAYVNGDIEINGPLDDLIKLGQLNPLNLEVGSTISRLRKLNKNKKSKQQAYIEHHYDLGNNFYKLWLDPTMSYSCAYFKTPKDTLETAQRQKTEHILRKLQLEPGMKLLDIGSGWGHLLVTAAKKYKIQGTGVTLSKEQLAFAVALAKREGVDKLVKFQLLNYQDLPKKQNFDRVVSVGFFEHVGRGNLDEYFRVVDDVLKPGGISVLHSITHQDEALTDAWIDKYIFPGGYLPSIRETTRLMSEHSFYIYDYENLGQHYGMTIDKWRKAYEKNKSTILDMYDDKFYRMWQLYLLSAMTAFTTGSAHLSQWTFKKGQDPTWLLTRDYLYK